MAITESDIKIFASERLLDTPDGGGRITGNVVQDGVENNLFPDVSSLDRVYGRVSLRKAFASVQSLNTDTYFGAHAVIVDAPDDPKIDATLFTTESWSDQRSAARDRLERYLARGPKWPGQLLETQLEGQRAIVIAVRSSDPLPRINQGLVLVGNPGIASEYEQFVRVTRVTTTTRSFTSSVGGSSITFERVVATIEISDPLRQDFIGPPPTPFDDLTGGAGTPFAVLRDTRVADAAVYFGIKPLSAAGDVGDFFVDLTSVFSQLIPSAQSETAITDAEPSSQARRLFAAGDAPADFETISGLSGFGPGKRIYLGSPISPGSLELEIAGQTYTDAAGVLRLNGVDAGEVNYQDGIVTGGAAATSTGVGACSVKFIPAAAVSGFGFSAGFAVTPETRGLVYTYTANPIPTPGSTVIQYRSQGNWVELRDQGNGAIRGATGAGSGSVNFATGTITVTLGALPDVQSSVLYLWGQSLNLQKRSNALARVGVRVQLPSIDIGGGVLRAPTIDAGTTISIGSFSGTIGANGAVSGAISGFSVRSAGSVFAMGSSLPSASDVVSFSGVRRAAGAGSTVSTPAFNSGVRLIATGGPLVAGSLYIVGTGARRSGTALASSTQNPALGTLNVIIRDNGAGQIEIGRDLGDAQKNASQVFVPAGTVNYSTGEVSFAPPVVPATGQYAPVLTPIGTTTNVGA